MLPGQSLPDIISRKLQSQGLATQVINAGRSGDTSVAAFFRLQHYKLASIRPRCLLVELGSNDVLQNVPLATLKQNLVQIIQYSREQSPGTRIYLYEMKILPGMGTVHAEAYRSLFSTVAREQKIELIPFPLHNVAGHPELSQADGLHPNAAGTRLMAENVWQAIQTCATENGAN